MRILITGGAGFIGSHLAQACLERGDEVYVLDDLSTGSAENLAPMQKDPGLCDRLFFTKGSILDRETLLELVGTCDQVFHLAAAVGVRYILDNPLESIRINIQGTDAVLSQCARFRKKVLITSSSEVYGKHLHAPLKETDDIVYGPTGKFRWSYAASKLVDEFTALAYHRNRGLEVITARLFNTVGPRQTGAYGMVIPRLVQQALKNEPLTVYGTGAQTRTFTYVKDVVRALLSLMDHPDAVGGTFNVGGTEEVSILELAQRIIKATGSSSEIRLIPYEEAFPEDFEDMQRRVPDISRIRELTGYVPKTGLDEILAEVIAYMRQAG
ncbi:MAG: GDP-mannose 4,6-dehydratase [Deltaproteobacteria bacterium]|nr:GDP-mannose 4,6-dehydratase [Deltaproteobacteria bacterium]